MTQRDARPLVLLSGLATGGAERVTVSFVRRLRDRGTPVSVCTVTARHDGPLAVELATAGVPRHDLGARRLAQIRPLGRLLGRLRHERPTVVHAHGQDAAILAAAARRLTDIPLVITRHVLDEPAATKRERFRARATIAALRRADAVIAVSHAVAERLVEQAGVRGDSIHVIHNGIDVARYGGSRTVSRRALRAALSPEGAALLVLVPSALREGKGHEVLLRAVPALHARVPSMRLLFAGAGEREPALRALARGLEPVVQFLGHRTDIPDLLAACDLVVLPSLAEGLPTALIEAAAAGRPVVATRVGGVPEVVVDGHTGALVPPNDPAALAESIAALLRDGARARRYGAAARHVARQRFAIETHMDRTLNLWAAVGRCRRGPRRPRGNDQRRSTHETEPVAEGVLT